MAKSKIIITIDNDPLHILRESQEERKERVRTSKPMGTQVELTKKGYNRKQKHKRKWEDE